MGKRNVMVRTAVCVLLVLSVLQTNQTSTCADVGIHLAINQPTGVEAELTSAITKSYAQQKFLVYHPCGGLNNNRLSAVTAILLAKFANITLVLPHIPKRIEMCNWSRPCEGYHNKNRWWENVDRFDYVYNRTQFIQEMNDMAIDVVESLPACLARHFKVSEFGPLVVGVRYLDLKNLTNAQPELFPPGNCDNSTGCETTWKQECSAHLMDLDCALLGVRPTNQHEWKLFKRAFLSMQPHNEILSLVKRIQLHLAPEGKNYWTFHPRIEGDVYFMKEEKHQKSSWWDALFTKMASTLTKSGIQKGQNVFLTVGLNATDERMRWMLQNENMTALGVNFILFEDLPVDIRSDIESGGRELEFRGVVMYRLCLESLVHIGTLSNSFDYMLYLERKMAYSRGQIASDQFHSYGKGGPGILTYVNGMLSV